jgi:hypothetical protein
MIEGGRARACLTPCESCSATSREKATGDNEMPRLTIHVIGQRPVPWGCGELEWRAAVAREARAAGGPSVPVPLSAQFSLGLVFRMRGDRIQHADLDNLAKPVLDTLFLSRQSQVRDPSLAGALFSVDDDRVFRLSLEKCVVPSAVGEGVDIEISW